MPDNITLSKASFVSLLDSMFPNPDDPGDPNNPFGPYGPLGPVIRNAIRDELSWFLLNPQPLPPRADPQPHPWRSAFIARSVISQLMERYQFAQMVAGSEQSGKMLEMARAQINQFVDDFCGFPPRPPWPWPWFKVGELQPVDLLVAGAQFQKAADFAANSPLSDTFAGAADRLFETGLERLQKG